MCARLGNLQKVFGFNRIVTKGTSAVNINRLLKAGVSAGISIGWLAVAGGLLAQTTVQQTTPTGQIRGTLQTSDGKPVAGAVVNIHARPGAAGVTFKAFDSTVVTGADGSFSAPVYSDGLYATCPVPPDKAHLDPCLWGSEPKTNFAAAALTAAVPTAIQLQPAADFYVRVNDPNGTRAAKEGKVAGVSLRLAVRSPNGMLLPIPLTATDSAGADYHMPVPTGTSLLFVTFGAGLTLTDSSGAAINQQTGKAITINIPAGQAQFKEVINVQ